MSAFSFLAVSLSPAMAASESPSGLSAAESEELNNLDTDDALDIVFEPPVDGAPGDRIGAGTRGATPLIRRIVLLAPKGGGLTVSESPRLYWWLSQPFEGTIEVKVEPVDDKNAALEVKRPISAEPGLQVLDLAQIGLALEEGKIYVWKLVLKTSDDVGWTSGLSFVERVARPEMAENEEPVQRARALAAAGIWYDALAAVARDPNLEKQRDSLLTSGGLTVVLGR